MPAVPKPQPLKVFIQGPGAFAYMAMFMQRGFKGCGSIEEADVVCFTGGADVSPEMYGETKIRETNNSQARDKADLDAYKLCGPEKFKVGICRGGQFLNVVNGGKMWQHVDNHCRDHYLIDLASGKKHLVTSTHHQMMQPTLDAEVIAIATESKFKKGAWKSWSFFEKNKGVPEENIDVESVWYENTRSLCFQPHPEHDLTECRDYFFEVFNRYFPKLNEG